MWTMIQCLVPNIKSPYAILTRDKEFYIFLKSLSPIIIIMSRHQHGYPWTSLATLPYRPSLPEGHQGYIPYLHRASVCRFELVAQPFSAMWRGPQEYITYELVPISPAVSRVSGSSNFDSFRDEWLVAVQLLLCRVLPPELVKYCSPHSCVVAVKPSLHPFS